MRRPISIIVLVLCICVVCLGAEFKKTPGPVELEDGDTFVFIGDSITHQCLYTQYVEDYFYTRYPDRRIHFRNAGIGGDKARDVLDRFDEDIAKFKPKYATILIGMNDGEYTAFEDRIFNTYKRDMTEMLDKLAEIGVKAIPMTPTMYDLRQALRGRNWVQAQRAGGEHYNAVLSFFGMWCLQQAQERGLGFVNMYEPLNRYTREGRKNDAEFTLIEDAVHPEEDGQFIMAYALLRDIGAEGPVWSIEITGQDNIWLYHAEHGKISDAQTNRIAFTFTANSLPFVVPEDAEMGFMMTDAKNTLSRQTLRVVGLESGEYRLLIDGNVADIFDYADLAKGVNLFGNFNVPDYRQAMEVAELNLQRNEDAIQPLRDMWIQLKFRRYRERGDWQEEEEEEEIDDDMSIEEWKEKVLSKEAQKLEEKAKEFEDKIYEINKPRSHTYELIKL